MISSRVQGALPNNTEANPREQVQAITFRSGKELQEVEKKAREKDKSLHINIPFADALAQMPHYAKFLKEILANKRKLGDVATVALNEECLAILLNKLPQNLKDPGSFTIPCTIVNSQRLKPYIADGALPTPSTVDNGCGSYVAPPGALDWYALRSSLDYSVALPPIPPPPSKAIIMGGIDPGDGLVGTICKCGNLAIEHADFNGIERLALVTGGEFGEDKLIHFSRVEMGQACTIVLRGASFHVLDEAERSLHDALCVLSQTVVNSKVLLGGAAPEMVVAKEVDVLARRTPGKKSHAIKAFSRALQAIPTTIADNASLDSVELISQLRAEHHKEGCTAGIDILSGIVGEMEKLGISEPFKVKQAVLLSATEAVEMILKVDEIITCAPRKREDRISESWDRENERGW
ncbi:PREDICTED: LOW QUALITY PROTEIN: T-complex protein 1 subunit delta-like [Nelumbo nucifera]|uniref:LOW QUALITY PROTEIN: T-complex protein 1 subunit delta-like n=1 Tax=Nelumbo nucifera TaxID=4432 RepID=A0A1U8QA14_NELNU|nr:PREDICTED: LOW QUALITY PROTEIN: T-complex protein 1 subunit delta-like [Nelumbo nucifera]